MAWSSPGGGQYPGWQTTHELFAPHPIAVRQSPGDQQAYAYSRASYTNNGDYPTPVHPPTAPPRHHQEPEWLRESRREHEAWEARRPQHAIYSPPPQQLPPSRSHAAQTTIGAARLPMHPAARQALSAAAPPPARPDRSAARMQPTPIPPPATRPRIDTRYGDARVDAHARAATWQEPPPACLPPSPTHPPPRPARAAARRSSTPTRQEHPPEAPPCATLTRATSSGDAGRTAPMTDRSSSSWTSTATAPLTLPVPPAANSTRSQGVPPPPPRLPGPRAPRHALDHRLTRTIDSDNVLQDVEYLRAIDEYVQEGGEKREKARGGEGEDALTRSVRGTPTPVSQIADLDISRVFASPRAPGTPAKATSRAAGIATRDDHESASPAVHHLLKMDERQRAPSTPVSTASRATTRRQDDHTTTTSPRPPPACPAARPALTPTRHELTPNAPLHARATLLSAVGQMPPPGSDRRGLSSTPTTTATSVHPVQTTTPSPLSRLDNRATRIREHIDSPQDVVSPRAIERNGREGRERGGKREDARERSVRDAQTSALHTADRDLSRDRDLLQTAATSEPTSWTSAAMIEGGGRPRGKQAIAETPAPTSHSHASRETASAKVGKDHRFGVVATSLAPYPSPPTADRAPSRVMKSSDTRQAAAARAADGSTTTSVPPRLARAALEPPPLPSPCCPPSSKLAPLKHPTPTSHSHSLPVEIHVPPPLPWQSTARRSDSTTRAHCERTIAPPAFPSSLADAIAAPTPSHHHDELKDTCSGREGEGGGRLRITYPSDRGSALAHHIPQYRSAREGGHLTAPATSTPPLPFPPHSRPALSKHPTPTLHPVHDLASLRTDQSTMCDRGALTQAARIEASSSVGVRDRTSSRLLIPRASAVVRAHSDVSAYEVRGARAEYTSVDNVHLARAPAIVRPARRAAGDHAQRGGRPHQGDGDFSSDGTQRGVHENPPAPNFVPSSPWIRHRSVSPPQPPRGFLLQPPPPPPGWPFPLSVEEMGWVLAAVVMARRMDQDDEQVLHDEDDNDLSPVSPSDDGHDRDDGSPTSSGSDFDVLAARDDNSTQHEYDLVDNLVNSASPALSPAAESADLEDNDEDMQDWGEASGYWSEGSIPSQGYTTQGSRD